MHILNSLVFVVVHASQSTPPRFPTEFCANVTIDTIQPGMPHYRGSYQVWQSLSQGLAAHLGDDGAGGSATSITMPTPSRKHAFTVYSVLQGTCYCVEEDIPSPPEFEPWQEKPPPIPMGSHAVDGRTCDIWQQTSWLIKNDTFTAAFEQVSGLPVQWTWRENGIRETKTYTTVVNATPPAAVFAIPSECSATKCLGYADIKERRPSLAAWHRSTWLHSRNLGLGII